MAARSQYKHPYLRVTNFDEYVLDRSVRQAAGYIGDMIHYEGRFFTQEEFDELFPAKLKLRVVQLDGRQPKNNIQ